VNQAGPDHRLSEETAQVSKVGGAVDPGAQGLGEPAEGTGLWCGEQA